MAKVNLRRGVKHHFDEHSLGEAKLQELEAMLADSPPAVKSTSFYQRLAPFSVAASLFVMAVSLLFLVQTEGDVRQKIASEVAQNHINMRPLEVSSNQFDDLKEYFTELNFVLVDSDRLNLSLLKGARYCSIQGKIAAQIRFKGLSSEEGVTHYQVEYDPDLYGPMPDVSQGKTPITLSQKGLSVSMWVERGLLMVDVKE